MSDSDRSSHPERGAGPQTGETTGGGRSSFLPPPAFPPGSHRRPGERSPTPHAPGPAENPADDAFISPDAPLPPRTDRELGRAGDLGEALPPDLGAGHGLDPAELRAAGDPWVLELTERIEKLAQALRQRGEAGLRADPEMDRFDGTLRAYCVGYLAGRRAGGEG